MIRSMNNAFGILAALTVVGCSTDGKDSGSAGGGEGGEESCDVTFTTFPEDGVNDFYFQSSVEALLSEADATATITLSDASGAEVAGTISVEDDTRVVFTPDADLMPSTEYSMTVSTCNGESGSSITFSTSELGTPIDCDLTGKSYRVNLLDARFIQPGEAIAALLFDALTVDVLLGIDSATETDIQMLGAVSESLGGLQDYCTPSIDFPTAATFDNPVFSVGPADTTLEVAGTEVTISGLNISGAFAPDCSYFGGGRLLGELDARVLAPLVGELAGTEDPDEICGFLAPLGVTCEPCASDSQPYCAQVEVDQITATNYGQSLACVSMEECHPLCSDNSEECTDPNAGDCSL